MAFGDVLLSRGANGPDVIERQLRLAGFRGTVWDGDFGPGTELQVRCCDRGRGVLVELSTFQIGWAASNRKPLEPSNIAPTWIHMDVRNYQPPHLADEYFVSAAPRVAAI